MSQCRPCPLGFTGARCGPLSSAMPIVAYYYRSVNGPGLPGLPQKTKTRAFLGRAQGKSPADRASAGCWRAPRAPPGWVAARLSLAKQAPLPARQPSQLRSWGCHRLPSSRPPLSRTARSGATGPQPRRAAGGHAGGRGCGGWRRRASGDPRVIGQVGNRAAEQSPRPLRGGPRPGRHGIARCRSIPGGEQRGTVKDQS